MMFKKILIANRGEIACRISKTARRLGVKTVGVYSDADKYSRHSKLVDESYLIGPPAPASSYLVNSHILEVAVNTGAEAVHPGYGFLSENAGFVKDLEKDNIKFIGPGAKAIESMGSKSMSKHIMSAANVPIVPGYHGEDQDPKLLLNEAKKIGFPVMLKAVLGGGGKGMRIVQDEKDFFQMLDEAKREAMKGFADDRMLIEKYIQNPRHIEFQIFGDMHGNYVHLNERDCSMQRRHQKVIEEAPSNIGAELRAKMGEASINAAKAVDYVNAGTVEFIFDNKTQDFYFMEMNTRLQVEHPITEEVTGLDLVEWQLRVAAGQELPIKHQKHIPLFGHSIEARIYSEDPQNNFLPGNGKISILHEPRQSEGNIRVDTGVVQGDEISTFYDPMISKLIATGRDRNEAIDRLAYSLSKYQIIGLPTNLSFLRRAVSHPEFLKGSFDTNFIGDNLEELIKVAPEPSLRKQGIIAISKVWLETLTERRRRDNDLDPWVQLDNFRINNRPLRSLILLNKELNTEQELFIEYLGENNFNAYVEDENKFLTPIVFNAEIQEFETPTGTSELLVRTDNDQFRVKYYLDDENRVTIINDEDGTPINVVPKKSLLVTEESVKAKQGGLVLDSIKSPMPGSVVKIYCKIGDEVKANEPLISIESMKMEYLIRAKTDVKIKGIHTEEAEFVQMKQKLITFDEDYQKTPEKQ